MLKDAYIPWDAFIKGFWLTNHVAYASEETAEPFKELNPFGLGPKYIVRFESEEIRDIVKKKLNASVHYPKPISEHPMYENIIHRKDDCPNAKLISETILTLPMHPYLTDDEINVVANTIIILT